VAYRRMLSQDVSESTEKKSQQNSVYLCLSLCSEQGTPQMQGHRFTGGLVHMTKPC